MAPKKDKKPTDSDETLEDRLERIAVSMVDEAETASDLEMRVTAVRAAAMVLGEKRKAEAEARKLAQTYTMEAVTEWIRAQPIAQRRALAGELERMNAGRSGLA